MGLPQVRPAVAGWVRAAGRLNDIVGVAGFVAWIGYSLFFYGLDQIRGGNNGFLSLIVPGKYSAQPNDSGGAGGNASANTLPAGSTGLTTNPGAAAGGQAVLSPSPGKSLPQKGFGTSPGDITPGNTGRFITGTPSSVPPAV